MKGTGRSVLQQLEDWLHDEQGDNFLWLEGDAGTGKSAIAQTFAEICFADGILGASFFCSRESQDRSDILGLICPTLAFQLAHQYPRFREELLKRLRTNPDIEQWSPIFQMEELIVGPFEATQIQTLIIIDALDECEDQSAGRLLPLLSRHAGGIPNVKFFITSRPMGEADYEFYQQASFYPAAKVLRLDMVERSLVDDDIRLILRTQLRNVPKWAGAATSQKTGQIHMTSIVSAMRLEEVSSAL